MKIWFCGTFAVGKTTLLEKSKIFFQDYHYIISTERELAKELDFDFNQSSIKEKISFQTELIKKQIQKEKDAKIFVTDTSLIDILAYSYFIKDSTPEIFEESFIQVIDSYFNHSWKYDLLFYIPIEFEIENDWVRHIDNDFRYYIDTLIKKHLDLFGKKIITLSWDIDNRIQILRNSL